MGRGGDGLLLQREEQERPEGVLLEEQIPNPRRKKGAREKDRSDADAGLQLVQEQAAEGQDTTIQAVSIFIFFFNIFEI